MRPQVSTPCVMDMDVGHFFAQVALLVVEARTPELSPQGRTEGPHCPVVTAAGFRPRQPHECDRADQRCAEAIQLTTRLRRLWSRRIPAVLQVLLLADNCRKSTDCMDSNAILLEEWLLQVVPRKSSDENLLAGPFLLQAMRSFLHFSQLSAWLSASSGKFPSNVKYRLCIPGETHSGVDRRVPDADNQFDNHAFPKVHLGKGSVMSVTVHLCPRFNDVPKLHCVCPSGAASVNSTTTVSSTKGTVQQHAGHNKTLSDSSLGDDSVDSDDEDDDECITIVEHSVQAPAPAPVRMDTPNESISTDTVSMCSTLSNSFTEGETEATRDSRVMSVPSRRSSEQSKLQNESRRSVQYRNSFSGWPNRLSVASSAADDLCYEPVSLPPRRSDYSATDATTASCVENPLFSSGSSTSILSRIEALQCEMNRLSSRLRSYSASKASASAREQSHISPRAQPSMCSSDHKQQRCRFFVSDDDDEEIPGPSSPRPRRDRPAGRSVARILFSSAVDVDMVSAGHMDTEVGVCCGDFDHLRAPSDTERTERSQSFEKEVFSQGIKAPLTVFHASRRQRTTGLNHSLSQYAHVATRSRMPVNSSPAPLKRNHNSFDFDASLISVAAIKNALSCDHESGSSDSDGGTPLCKSAPASTNLLGNFEESALNGRIKPLGSIDGFSIDLAASGAFCPPHAHLPLTTFFFSVSDDNAPSPYLGHCGLESLGRKGYHVPKKGTVQVTLFNPHQTVVKMFVVRYDLAEMPPSCQTFVRQRTFFMPTTAMQHQAFINRHWLRYLIHLRFATSKSSKLYLHTDIRMLFSRKSELDADNIKSHDNFELRSFTEMPRNPKYSPRKGATAS